MADTCSQVCREHRIAAAAIPGIALGTGWSGRIERLIKNHANYPFLQKAHQRPYARVRNQGIVCAPNLGAWGDFSPSEGMIIVMKKTHWLAALGMGAALAVGTSAQAGLFDRISEAAADARDRAEARNKDRIELAEAEVGPITAPARYELLTAPGQNTLAPVPESYGGPTIAPPLSGAPHGQPVPSYPPPSYAPPAHHVDLPPSGVPIGPAGPVESFGVPLMGQSPDPISLSGPGVPLFDRVKYKDLDHIHPCAVPVIVKVLNPLEGDDCHGCGPGYVFVEVMMPPGRPDIRPSKGGRKVKYKFPEYQVEIRTKKGYVEVDYDD